MIDLYFNLKGVVGVVTALSSVCRLRLFLRGDRLLNGWYLICGTGPEVRWEMEAMERNMARDVGTS